MCIFSLNVNWRKKKKRLIFFSQKCKPIEIQGVSTFSDVTFPATYW